MEQESDFWFVLFPRKQGCSMFQTLQTICISCIPRLSKHLTDPGEFIEEFNKL